MLSWEDKIRYSEIVEQTTVGMQMAKMSKILIARLGLRMKW